MLEIPMALRLVLEYGSMNTSACGKAQKDHLEIVIRCLAIMLTNDNADICCMILSAMPPTYKNDGQRA